MSCCFGGNVFDQELSAYLKTHSSSLDLQCPKGIVKNFTWKKTHFAFECDKTSSILKTKHFSLTNRGLYYKKHWLGYYNSYDRPYFSYTLKVTDKLQRGYGFISKDNNESIESKNTNAPLIVPFPLNSFLIAMFYKNNYNYEMLLITQEKEPRMVIMNIEYDMKKGMYKVFQDNQCIFQVNYASKRFLYEQQNHGPYVWISFSGYNFRSDLLRNDNGTSYVWWDGTRMLTNSAFFGMLTDPAIFGIQVPESKVEHALLTLKQYNYINPHVVHKPLNVL